MTDQLLTSSPSTTASSSAATTASLAAFDALAQGSPAPTWLRDGVVDAWAFDASATQVTLITVSENATFLVREHGRPVAVTRVARPGYMADPAAFESEVAWVAALGADGAAEVPTGLRSRQGTYAVDVSAQDGHRWTCVTFGYVPGSILEDIADPVPYYAQIGRTTAELHEHAAAWVPPTGFTRHSWELADMVGPGARWGRWEDADLDDGALALLGRAQRAALDALADVPRTPAHRGLIHADLRPSNIMIDGDVLTVIDFDDCGYGWFAYDFASALTFMEHVPYADAMAKEWLAGYAEVRPLDVLDVRRACALSMVRRLQMLGWTTTHREDALPPELWAAQPEGTVQVAEAYLRRPTWLVD